MRRLIFASVFILACTLANAGCGDDDPQVITPVETPPEINETFSGTLTLLGAATHTFATANGGEIATVEIESLAPDSAAVVSLIFGTWNGTYCQVVFVKDDATTGTTFVGNASLGQFCVRIADIGRLTEPTAYSITVTHF